MRSHNAEASRLLARRALLAPLARLAPISLAALLAAGCATGIKIGSEIDPLSLLSPGSAMYARLSGEAARSLLPALLPSAQAKALAPLLSRTRVVAIGIGGSDRPAFQACLIGDFPFRAAALSLGTDPAWAHEKTGYFNAKLGLHAGVPGPNLVLASSQGLEPLLATARAPGPSPLPAGLGQLAARELLVWVPEPFSGLAKRLGVSMDVPARGLLVSASAAPAAASGSKVDYYAASVVFLMKDPESARVFRPALRLAWYALSSLLLGGEVPRAEFVLDAAAYRADGVTLSSAQIAGALSGLAGGLGLIHQE